jgi:hypothetical protein
MGQSIKPKYALEVYETRMVDGKPRSVLAFEGATWDTKRHGRPDSKNLEKYVLAYGKSLETGGSNFHITEAKGYVSYPNRAVIRFNHSNGATVASWQAPAFMVW